MSFINLPPGNILQNLYLKERLKSYSKSFSEKTFLEIGSGNGYVSSVFLKMGWKGIGIDLNESACENNKKLNQTYIQDKKYQVVCENFLKYNPQQKFDVIISCMVIEHLIDSELEAFINKMKNLLNANGVIILQVLANMKFWNIEDEIAGHIKRYEKYDVDNLCNCYNLRMAHLAALNYPLSNLLFNLSNYLIKKNESDKLQSSQKEKTIYTGNRNVPFKTTFPKIFSIILNPIVLYPFHILQKLFINKINNSLVIYFELKK
jgi:SAM-dependent methyltransferase